MNRLYVGNVRMDFKWQSETKNIKISTLADLLKVLIDIDQEDINREVTLNVLEGKLLEWIKETFPHEIRLIQSITSMVQEFTPQQVRELLIRELRVIK
jgi:hypothetical protein